MSKTQESEEKLANLQALIEENKNSITNSYLNFAMA
jgi:hypothetical protein